MSVTTATNEMDTPTFMNVAAVIYQLINGEQGHYGPNFSVAIATTEGRFLGGFVFNNFMEEAQTAEVHIAGVNKGWLKPNAVYALMRTAVDLKLRMVIAKTTPENREVIRLMTFAGARKYRIADVRGPGQDEVLLTLKMSDMVQTKFWRKYHGRQVS